VLLETVLIAIRHCLTSFRASGARCVRGQVSESASNRLLGGVSASVFPRVGFLYVLYQLHARAEAPLSSDPDATRSNPVAI
jgi:hypothetical protein